ncbi:hypothetical protein [Pseudoalteromonas fuliginea]|uniref:hypothetical protein n=1 Tax=Pseudoalteromonas fuliginea TaxID=1872678 RepID=UPI0031769E88
MNIKQKLADVNAIYKNEPRLKICNEIGIFTAFLNYAFKSTDDINLLHSFASWLIFNYIDEVKSPDAASVIDVFDKVHSSQLSVFMAMPYFNDAEVDFANKSLSGAVASIKDNNPHVNLLAHPIMRTCSPTHDLIEDIFNKIKACNIFIADITGNNPNVLYEYGFARGQTKDCILMRKANAEDLVKSDYANDLRFEYGQYDLSEKLKIQIENVLKANGIMINI